MLQLTKKQYKKEKWYKDTMEWIANIPEELDSKEPVPMKHWKVFEADALDAARDAAMDAAWGAAKDASLMAGIKICSGLKIDKKYIDYTKERWEANMRGFRVWCDVDGVLYVYRARKGEK